MLIEKIAVLLNKLGLKKQSEFLRLCCLEGSRLSDGKGSNSLINTLKGIFSFIKDPKIKANIKRNMSIALAYSDSKSFENFLTTEKSSQTTTAARLIAKRTFDSNEIKILDIGCHYGYLVDDIKKHSNLNLQRYIGLDLGFDSIEKAKVRLKQKYNAEELSKYFFYAGNALSVDLYKKLPKDNNVIACIGLSHINSDEAKILLNNFKEVMSDTPDSRIYFSYSTFEEHNLSENINLKQLLKYLKEVSELSGQNTSDFDSFLKGASQREINAFVAIIKKSVLEKVTLEEQGVMNNVNFRVYRFNNYEFRFNAKDKCQFEKFINDCGFEIENENSFKSSIIIGLGVEYLCLKKR